MKISYMELYPYNASFNGHQTVEGQNYCFIVASKGYKRYQVLSSETISRKKRKSICFINTNARLFCYVLPRLYEIRNDVEKVTLDVGSISSSPPSSDPGPSGN